MGVIMKNKVNYTGGGSGGASALADLEDVELTTPTDGQALVYDAENDLWINGGVVGSGGGSAKYSETVLWNGSKNTTGTITLSESIKNFSIIMIMISSHPSNTNYYKIPWYILVSEITDYTTTYQFEPFGIRGAQNANDRVCMLSLHFANDTSISIDEVSHGSNAMATLLKVIGIRWETMQTALIYSEEEREVGVWSDGKPLYQKTINFGALPLTATKTVAHNIADVDKIWVYDGFVYGTSGIYYQLNRTTNSFTYQWETRVDSTNVVMQDFAAFGNDHSAIITLQYTKTTDTAGSGIWTTTGEYAHHYSTDEKVVGTWIDGRPLYERTFQETIAGDTSVDLDTGIDFCMLMSSAYTQTGNITETLSTQYINASIRVYCYVQSYYSNGVWSLKMTNMYSQSLKWTAVVRYTKVADL